jgi:hypothetical protein
MEFRSNAARRIDNLLIGRVLDYATLLKARLS